jgi:hypothetical protein
MAEDFWRFRPQDRQTGRSETKANTQNAGISGLLRRLSGSLAERQTGWLRREFSNPDMAS